jgi:hypothetical protein
VPTLQHGEEEHRPGPPRSRVRKTGTRNLTTAVAEGRLEGLYALRDAIAAEIERGQGEKAVSQTAPLARQLRETLREIAELEKAVPKGSVVDDLAARRTARNPVAKGRARTAKRDSK